MKKDENNNLQYTIEEIEPDKNQLLDEKIKSEQAYIDILNMELKARKRMRFLLRFFKLKYALNEKAIFKISVEIMMKMNFISNVHRLKTKKQENANSSKLKKVE